MSDSVEQNTALKAYLAALGERVRAARAKRGMARRILARDSGVSERYLAQLESGSGNPTVAVLRHIADAVDYPLSVLISGSTPDEVPQDLVPLVNRLRGLPPEKLSEAKAAIDRVAGAQSQPSHGNTSPRAARVALIGLRGGGKSTLGRMLADRLHVPFLELNRLVEQEYGGSIGEILALSGQSGLRRIEHKVLESTIANHPAAVIATGGGIVSETATFQCLLDRCHTIWVQASPEEHMSRVISQGDLRPMARNDEAMDDLKAILKAREPGYHLADASINTSGQTIQDSLATLENIVQQLLD